MSEYTVFVLEQDEKCFIKYSPSHEGVPEGTSEGKGLYCVMCHVSSVTCHMSHVTCHVSLKKKNKKK